MVKHHKQDERGLNAVKHHNLAFANIKCKGQKIQTA